MNQAPQIRTKMQKALVGKDSYLCRCSNSNQALKLGPSPSIGTILLRSQTTLRSSISPCASLALLDGSTCPWNTSKMRSVRSFSICSRLDWPRHTRKQRSSRSSAKDEDVSMADVISKLDLPTTEDMPTLPENILKDPVNMMKSAKDYLAYVEEEPFFGNGKHEHVINVDDPMVGTLRVVGSGSTKTVAQKVANLQLLAKLHEKNVLATLFPLKENQVNEERDALLDIHLYAARYEDVPQITTKAVSGGNQKGTFFDVQITVPSLAITTSARAKSRRIAMVRASVNTRQAMERLVQDAELNYKLIKEDEVFSLKSAIDFCQWYRIRNRGMTIELNMKRNPQGSDLSYCFMTVKDIASVEGREFEAAPSLTKKGAEDLAHLVAAVAISREEPRLRHRFFQEYRENNNQVMVPLAPTDLEIAEETMASIKKAIDASKHAAEQLEEDEIVMDRSERSKGTIYSPLPEVLHQRKSDDLQTRHQAYCTRQDLAALRKTRSEYPMNQYGEEVLKTIKSNIYSIVIGATGSGKTTQVPQILLNDAITNGEGANCNIICTQPRRIAAKSVAQRVADERAEFIGDCVGYHVKGDARLPQYGGCINYCTTGILSQQLQFAADQIMDNVSHIIVDEVHERDTVIDFTLTALKRLVKARIAEGKKVPHIILMSATIDADLFAGYLSVEGDQGENIDCPTLTVPGRTFPVKEMYLDQVLQKIQSSPSAINLARDPDAAKFIAFEQDFSRDNKVTFSEDGKSDETESTTIDWAGERRKAKLKGNITVEEQEQALVPHALVASTIMHIASSTNEGAILTFLPGLDDMSKVLDILQSPNDSKGNLDFRDASKFKIYLLHSTITDTQKEVFDQLPAGCRKIILATNIAETSITIPDVQHVVDTGKHREIRYDQSQRITKLSCVWVSKSNAKQRAGRAGRVQNGNYYALYSKERYESLRAVGLPEILRSDLQEVCLDVKNQGFATPVKEFLSETIEPPASESVDRALSDLVALQALNEDEALTPLGKLLAQLPVHPSLGKMIVLGIVFRCLDPMLIIGSSFSARSLFLQPLGARDEATEARVKFCKSTLSDHIGLLTAIKELRMIDRVRGQRALYDYSSRNYVHVGAYHNILSTAQAIEDLLQQHGVIPRTSKISRVQFQFGDPRLNENSDKVGLIKALILAGFYPNLAIRKRTSYRTSGAAVTMVHPRSVNTNGLRHSKSKGKTPPPLDPKRDILSFSELVRSNDGGMLYLRETTAVTPLMSILFGGKLEAKTRNQMQIDGWLPFYFKNSSHMPLVLTLHKMLQKVTSAAFHDLAARRALLDHEDRNHFADLFVEVLDSDLMFSAEKSAKGSLFLENRAVPSAAFSGFPKSQGQRQSGRNIDPKMLGALSFLTSDSGLPSGMDSLANNRNPIPPRAPRALSLYS